jgi:hypothetical protein
MSKLGVALLWSCALLFVVSGTLLSTAAGLPKFAVISGHSETSGPESGLGAYDSDTNTSDINTVDIGAFTAIYYDGDFTFTSSIDDNCQVNWEGYEEGFFRESDSTCTQFKVFRSFLIIAIVFDFLLALAIYTCILQRWLPPSVTEPVPSLRHTVLALCCVVAMVANVVSMSIMIKLVFSGISGGTTYGVSFKLMAAAFPVCVIAGAVFAVDCIYHAYVNKSGRPTISAATTSVGDEESTVKDVEMAVMKSASGAAELTEVYNS